MSDTVLYQSKWFTVKSKGDYEYVDTPPGIGILPFRINKDKEIEFLVLLEHNPLHDNPFPTIITERYEEDDIDDVDCILRGLEEEAGIIFNDDAVEYEDILVVELGMFFLGKATQTADLLVAIDVAETLQVTPTTDGTQYEKESKCKWVSLPEFTDMINSSMDAHLIVAGNRFLHYLFTNMVEEEIGECQDELAKN